MTTLSVNEVALLCNALGRAATTIIGREARKKYTDELLKGLGSDFFPDAQFKNAERRPLLKYYERMLPACSEDVIEAWQGHSRLSIPADNLRLCQAHPTLFQEQCLQEIADSAKYFDFAFLPTAFPQPPTKTSDEAFVREHAVFSRGVSCSRGERRHRNSGRRTPEVAGDSFDLSFGEQEDECLVHIGSTH